MPRRRLSELETPALANQENRADQGPQLLAMAPTPGLAERAAEAIVLGVASGVLQPGQRLVEVELARMLKMSRVPLREALKILEAQGIVESAPHRGTHLATFDEARIDEICEARLALEKIAMRGAMAAYRRDPGLLARLDKVLGGMERAARHLEWIEISQADLDFHREICRVSGNAIVQKLWDAIARHVLIVFGKEIRSERDARTIVAQHKKLRDILAAGKAEALDDELDQHILRLQRRKGRNVR
jgi:DNA-binding GntR family transcriptional regulator